MGYSVTINNDNKTTAVFNCEKHDEAFAKATAYVTKGGRGFAADVDYRNGESIVLLARILWRDGELLEIDETPEDEMRINFGYAPKAYLADIGRKGGSKPSPLKKYESNAERQKAYREKKRKEKKDEQVTKGNRKRS